MEMNRTYDPSIMAKMPLIKFIPRKFDQKNYEKMLENFQFELSEKTKKYLTKIVREFFYKNMSSSEAYLV